MTNQDRRTELITAAQQLFYTKGYESTSVNDIINAVGVSKGAFYHYFDSKEAVLVAVVAELVKQTSLIIEPILDDGKLTAIEKFNQMTRATGNWKNERREQIMSVMRVMYSNDNLHLRYRLQSETMQIIVPMLSQIFEQGVVEGAFDLGGVKGEDAAECIVSILRTMGEIAMDLMLDPDRPADAADIALGKYAAAQKMIERMLGAPAGSLSLIEQEIFRSWFV